MAITTTTEVKFAGGFTNEYSEQEILTEIDIVEATLYQKYNLPKRSSFSIDDDYTNFFIYPDRVHEVIRLQVAVDSTVDPSGYLGIATDASTWEHASGSNFITLGSDFIEAYDAKIVRVQHIPKIFNEIATNVVALNLIDTPAIIDGDQVISSQITRLQDRITRYKNMLKPKRVFYSSKQEDYDPYEYTSYSQSDLR